MRSQYKSEEARSKVFAAYDAVLSHWPIVYDTRFVQTQFGPTHLVVSGAADAPPLVLLHGLATNATCWQQNVAAMADRFRVYAPDTIGDAGKSAGTRPAYASGDHSRWVAEVFERLELGRARVAGLSLGGWIAFHFAATHPDRVERLALLAPAEFMPMSLGFGLRGMLTCLFPREARVRRFFRYLASRQYGGMPDWMMHSLIIGFQAARPDLRDPPVIQDARLSALRPPTLLLLGSEDPIYDAAKAASRVRSVAPHIQVEIIQNAGHLFVVEQPEATNKALLQFFA